MSPFVFRFRFLSVNVYWQAESRTKYDPDLRQTEQLIVLPNTQSVDTYKARALELAQSAESQTTLLAGKEAEFNRYIAPMAIYKKNVRDALALGDLYKLGQRLEEMLTDPGVKDDPNKPNMADLWKHDEMK